MCGINGILRLNAEAPPLDRDELLRTSAALARRGPDGAGHWLSPDGWIGLGHRRLAILDLSAAGDQPMLSPDGRYAIVFNGEIYNFRELRADLQARGAVFRSQSDTEVLLELFSREGVAMLGRLRGMFALAVWDERERRLLLARDTFGIKPLYYSCDGRVLRFASQVKALEAAGVSTDVDPVGLGGFLLWGSVPEPWTIRKAVRALPAGHWLEIQDGRVGPATRFEPWQGQALGVAEALSEAVRAHLVSDVPVGVFLSAGLDSALVSALVRRHTDRPLRTFTLTFESFLGTELDEGPGAAQLARTLGTAHTERRVGQAELEAAWPEALAAMDQPSIDGFNVYLVSRFAREAGLKVVLSGLGGDELFGSYPSFRDVPRWHRWARRAAAAPGLASAWRALTPLWRGRPKLKGLLSHGLSLEGAYLLRRGLLLPEELPEVLGPECAREALAAYDPLAGLRGGRQRGADDPWVSVHEFEVGQYLRNQLLRDADWASMAHSLELRVPLVDAPLHAAVARARFEPARTLGKAALVEQVVPEIPTGALQRAKTGFTVSPGVSPHPSLGWGQRARGVARDVLRHFGIDVAPTPGERGGTLFLLPEAFRSPGGIQRHDRTLVQALRRCRPREPLAALVLNDLPQDVETSEWRALSRRGFARDRLRFTLASLATAWRQRPERVLLGHRGFLPLAPLLRLVGQAPTWLLTYGVEAQPRLTALEWWSLSTSCDRVFAISPFTRDLFRDAGCQARVELWPCSLPPDWPLGPASPPRLEAPFRLLTVSRLDPRERYKGVEDLLLALARLRARGVDAVVEVVGDGEDRGRLERVAATAGLADAVVFRGRVAPELLRGRYQASDVFVLPSAAEGFGLVYLEAMACWRPVVAAAAGATPFVVEAGHTGWLVPHGRPDLLADRLAALLGDRSGTLAVAREAHRTAAARFSFEALCGSTRMLLGDTASSTGGRP